MFRKRVQDEHRYKLLQIDRQLAQLKGITMPEDEEEQLDLLYLEVDEQ